MAFGCIIVDHVLNVNDSANYMLVAVHISQVIVRTGNGTLTRFKPRLAEACASARGWADTKTKGQGHLPVAALNTLGNAHRDWLIACRQVATSSSVPPSRARICAA